MTARTSFRADAEADLRRVEELAAAWLVGEWTDGLAAELYRLVASRSRMATWSLFEEFARLVDLRDGVNDGRTHWSEVDPDITGLDPSAAAYEVAVHQVEDAARALLGRWA